MNPIARRSVMAHRFHAISLAFTLAVSSLHAQPVLVPAPAPPPLPLESNWNPSTVEFDFSRARAAVGSARLTNVSIRAKAGGGADTLIAGAALQGSGRLPMLVRAIGPGLSRFGVSNPLRDPKLQIFRSSELAAETTTTAAMTTSAAAYVGAFPTQGFRDAALIGQIVAGVLTAHCSSVSDASGVALLEFYDAAADATANRMRFVNLSSRARVETGEGVVVVGFVVAGEGRLTLLLRGVGRTLEQFGVAEPLANPRIDLFAGSTRIAANDDWRTAPADAIAAVTAAWRLGPAARLALPAEIQSRGAHRAARPDVARPRDADGLRHSRRHGQFPPNRTAATTRHRD